MYNVLKCNICDIIVKVPVLSFSFLRHLVKEHLIRSVYIETGVKVFINIYHFLELFNYFMSQSSWDAQPVNRKI